MQRSVSPSITRVTPARPHVPREPLHQQLRRIASAQREVALPRVLALNAAMNGMSLWREYYGRQTIVVLNEVGPDGRPHKTVHPGMPYLNVAGFPELCITSYGAARKYWFAGPYVVLTPDQIRSFGLGRLTAIGHTSFEFLQKHAPQELEAISWR